MRDRAPCHLASAERAAHRLEGYYALSYEQRSLGWASQRAPLRGCVVEHGGAFHLWGCALPLGLPDGDIGVRHLASYRKSLATPVASIAGDVSSLKTSCARVVASAGSKGGWGELVSPLWRSLFGYASSLDFHSPRSYGEVFVSPSPPHHWLAHYDYDWKLRRRLSFAVNFLGSEGRWALVISQAWQLCAPSVASTTVCVLCAAQAYASIVHACESISAGVLSAVFACIFNFIFCCNLLGADAVQFLRARLLSVARFFGSAFEVRRRAQIAPAVAPGLLWAVLFARLPMGACVCLSCAGNDPNCKGDDTCVLAMALATNLAVMAGTAAAGKVITMGEDGKHILPLSWLQFLKPSVLQTLVRLANRAPSGTPLVLATLSIKELSSNISSGTISVSEGRLELLRRMSEDNVSDTDLLKMKTICDVLPQRGDESRFLSPMAKLSGLGALQFVFALSSQVVLRLTNSAKISVAIGDTSLSSSTGLVSIELKRPASADSFVYTLSVWQTILGATGLANVVVTGPFLAEVVYDVIPVRGWRVALEHFLLYIAKIDSGCGWQLATATSLGSHDTFMHKALFAAGESGKGFSPEPSPGATKTPVEKEGGRAKIVWNGKFNSDASARPCAAFNLGQEHRNLKSDGSCPFNHVCNQWVSDKGKGGQCRASHPRSTCSNSSKCESRVE